MGFNINLLVKKRCKKDSSVSPYSHPVVYIESMQYLHMNLGRFFSRIFTGIGYFPSHICRSALWACSSHSPMPHTIQIATASFFSLFSSWI